MKLHRLQLTHFRGVTEREVHFADVGVTVVEGANEAGKSSMIEALDLLLEARSDSKSSKVRAVSPAGVDAGTIVEADITCGPYRFTYTKQYNKAARTELVVHEPTPEQFAGRIAHDKVCAILAETVDAGLFKALRLLQAGDPTVGDLAASSALSRALDAAAGTADPGAESGGAESMLLDSVRSEYERYFTATQGRPARELAAATADLDVAAARHAELTAAMELLADDAARLETLTGNRRDQANSLEIAKVELATLAERREQARGLQRRHADAQAAGQLLKSELQLLDREDTQRAASQKRISACDTTIEVTQHAMEQLRGGVADNSAALAEMERRLDAAREEDALATRRVRSARAAAQAAHLQERLDEVSAVLGRVDQVRAEMARQQRELAGLEYGQEDLAAVEELAQNVAIALAQSESAAATLSVTRLGTQSVSVDGTGTERSELAITAKTIVEVDGVVRVSVTPGAESATLAERLSVAERALSDALHGHGVGDVAALRGLVRARERATNALESLHAQLAAILGGGDEDALRAELSELRGRVDVPGGATDDARDVADAEAQSDAAALGLTTLIQQAAELRSEQRSFDSELRVLKDRLSVLTTEREELLEQHRELGAAQSDDRREQIIAELDPAEAAVAVVAQQIAEADLETLELQHTNMAAVVERGEPRLAELGTAVAELRTRIEIRRDDGNLDQLHLAATDLESARGEQRRVEVRAQAAKLLLETLERHRDNTRRQYVAPFTDQILRLGRVVFGPSLQVGVDEELRITTRTVDGVTVDHEALSGGAKEQLGIISRLACAMLVDPADGVPVIIDDALGYTDPARLASMGAVLGHAGLQTQVIVLTCTPQRYSSVGGAHLIAV